MSNSDKRDPWHRRVLKFCSNRHFAVIVALIWQAMFIVVAACLVGKAWPGRGAHEWVLRRNETNLIAGITGESLGKLHRAREILDFGTMQQPGRFTSAELRAITEGLDLASEINSLPPGTNSYDGKPAPPDVKPAPPDVKPAPPDVKPAPPDVKPAPPDVKPAPPDVKPADVKKNPVPGQPVAECVISIRQTPGMLTPPSAAPTDTGDLVKLTSARRNSYLKALDSAIKILRERSPGDTTKLASVEYDELQKRLEGLLNSDSAYFLGSRELALLVLVAAFGAIGGATQALTSIARYVGDRMFQQSWLVFYLCRPIGGAVIAVTFLFLFSSGLATPPTSGDARPPSAANPSQTNSANTGTFGSSQAPAAFREPKLFYWCALALLVGLCTGQATDKVSKIAGAFFTDNVYKDDAQEKRPMVLASDVSDSPMFSTENIVDLGAMIKALTPPPAPPPGSPPIADARDLVSQYLATRLARTMLALSGAQPVELTAKLAENLVADLNEIILGPSIFSEERFPEARKNPCTKELIDLNPQSGPRLAELNRKLLLAAYPKILSDRITYRLVKLIGANFRPESVVYVDGRALAPDEKAVFADKWTLTTTLRRANHPSDKISAVVFNPEPNSDYSAAFEVSLDPTASEKPGTSGTDASSE